MKLLISFASLLSLLIFSYSPAVFAANAADWKAGRIIDDAVFTDKDAMSARDIQAFLNDKVGRNGRGTPGVCDTKGERISEFGGGTRADYGAANGNPAPFTCLKDYHEVPKTTPGPGIPANNYGGAPIPAGAKSAAQLIWDAAQRYNISPKVLLVTIHKESAGPLTTDDWPFRNQYTYAMGAHCPDSGPNGSANCNPDYAGFSIQISESAKLMRYYLDNMDKSWWPYKKLGNNSVLFHPNTSCGSSIINIETRATAALYTYTPYQPNQAALNNLYGTGDGCSAYGNRNFWRIFTDWFGSTQTNIPYAWNFAGQSAHSNSARTQLQTSTTTVAPNESIYLTVKARNNGFKTWNQSNMRIGTSRAQERSSIFYDSSWFSKTRPAVLKESSVGPGQIGTFEFAIKAPAITGTYNEYFNLVADGETWLNDLGQHFLINVVDTVSASNANNTNITSDMRLLPGQYILSPDSNSLFTLQKDGNLVLYNNYRAVWNSGTNGSSVSHAIMQGDGNFTLYSNEGTPLWHTGTYNNPGSRLQTQTDGNLVIYSSNGAPLWSTNTVHYPNLLSYVNFSISSSTLRPGQRLETADRSYRMTFQTDGNVVLYSKAGVALWNTRTSGKGGTSLLLQNDGNFVLYDQASRAIWSSGTHGNGASRLIMQTDGNLVLYSATRATWSSNTQQR